MGNQVVLCRFFIKQQRYQETAYILDKLYDYAESQQHRRLLVEVLLIQSIMQYQQHLLSKAADSLQKAIISTHDSKFLRLFAHEDHLLETLLPLISKSLIHHPLMCDIMALLAPHTETPAVTDNTSLSSYLVLSKKERLVARKMISGASSQEIAEMLCVSLSTIKTHTQNIYTKLGVNKRPQAIEMLLRLNLAT